MGVIKRNWRTRGYCGSLQPPQEAKGRAARSGAGPANVLFVPVERRFPMIRCVWRLGVGVHGVGALLVEEHCTWQNSGSCCGLAWFGRGGGWGGRGCSWFTTRCSQPADCYIVLLVKLYFVSLLNLLCSYPFPCVCSISTRQADTLMDKRIVVVIDGWDADSAYPRGHYTRTLGVIGDRDTETVRPQLHLDATQ